jgi:hypothetical protein
MPPAERGSMVPAPWHRMWAAALDALEADVAEVEKLIGDDHRVRDLPITDPWSPPAGLATLPLDLLPRADHVLGRQIAATHAIALAIATNRRQAAMTARVEAGGQGAPGPAYVDYAM